MVIVVLLSPGHCIWIERFIFYCEIEDDRGRDHEYTDICHETLHTVIKQYKQGDSIIA